MMSVIYLFEGKPDNPNSIILLNEYYPKGLTQQQIYNYYMINKDKVLNQVKNREVMFFFAVSKNQFIIRRKTADNEYYKLTSSNYEDMINGRVVSIHSTLSSNEEFGIIDIDFHIFDQCKKAAAEVYDYLFKYYNKDLQIRYTGKQSFHIIYNFNRLYRIDIIKNYLKDALHGLNKKYIINGKRSEDKINLDLSSNKYRGGFITLNSLSINGLKCTEIKREDLDMFTQNQARI